jgi:hypothetical protein
MTSYEAYNAGLPCQNPSCKSYGKPHPNCRCYSNMAEGGESKRFCSMNQSHEKDCQYFADGGETPSDQTQDNSQSSSSSQPLMFDDLQNDSKTSQPQQFDTLQDDSNAQLPSFDDLQDDSITEKKQSYPEMLGASLESVGRGFLGPIPGLVEEGASKLGVPDLSFEDQSQRQQAIGPVADAAYEVAGLGASAATSFGLLPAAAHAAELLNIPKLGIIGGKALQAFVSNALVGASNETTKAMLGQGDPIHPVAGFLANVGLTGLIGGALQGAGQILSSSEAKIGSKIASLAAGFGAKSSNIPIISNEGTQIGLNLLDKNLYDEGAFNAGYKLYDKMISGAVSSASIGLASQTTNTLGASAYYALPIIEKIIGPVVKKAGNLIMPTLAKTLSEGLPSKTLPILNYATQINHGNILLNSMTSALVKGGAMQTARPISNAVLNEMDNWIKNGGVDQELQDEQNLQNTETPEGYADGGEVKEPERKGVLQENPISMVYPEQNILLQAAKGRISNYLKSIRPQKNQQKLAFDPEPDQTIQNKSYQKALKLAANPLSILHEAQNNMLDMDHMKHFGAMYPELGNIIQQKLTEKITDAQLKGEKPNHKIRQSLSLLMGTPLSSEFTPQNMQAAQTALQMTQQSSQPQQSQQQPVTKNKKNTSTLSKSSEAFLTGNQALQKRQQNVK